jgi:hypothetical protein
MKPDKPASPSKLLLKILSLFLFVMLCLPGLQRWLNLSEERALDGYSPRVAENPDFTNSGWLSGTYQQQKEDWLNEHFGYRNTLLRLHNQIGYSWWNHSYTNAVVVGRDGYLFDQKYINAWNGSDFLGEEKIAVQVKKLAQVQQQLAELGTTVVVVLAPGKGSFFNSYIRGDDAKVKGETNYDAYLKHFKTLGINHIDGRNWFASWRKTSQYPLFPKCGIHWSTYSATLVTDSLNRYIGSLRGTVLAPLVIDKMIISDSVSLTDSDVGRGMNLLFEQEGFQMAYPVYHFDRSKSTEQPSLLAIGDSYYWTHDPGRFNRNVYSSTDFYYYNRDWHPIGEAQRKVNPREAFQQAMSHDVVVIYCTDANLPEFGWGFIEQVYEQLKISPRLPEMKQKPLKTGLSTSFAQTIPADVSQMMISIRSDESWFAAIKAKALQKGISADSMLYLDAKFMIDEQKKKK